MGSTAAFAFSVPLDVAVTLPATASLSRIIGMFAFAVATLAVIFTGSFRAPVPALAVPVALWCICAASLLWSIAPDETLTRTLTWAQIVVATLLVWTAVRTSADAALVALAYVLGGVVPILATIAQFVAGRSTGTTRLRYAVEGFDPNTIAAVTAVSIGLAFYVIATRAVRGPTIVLAGSYIAAAFSATVLTGSRSGALAATAALLIGLAAFLPPPPSRRSRRRVRHLLVPLGLVTLVGVGVQLIPEAIVEDIVTAIPTAVETGDLGARSAIWASGLQLFHTSPWLGVGAGGFRFGVDDLLGMPMFAHNSVLSMAVELGVLGASLFVLAWVLIARALWRARLPSRWAVAATVAALGVMSMTLGLEHKKVTWLVWTWALTALIADRSETRSGELDGRAPS